MVPVPVDNVGTDNITAMASASTLLSFFMLIFSFILCIKKGPAVMVNPCTLMLMEAPAA